MARFTAIIVACGVFLMAGPAVSAPDDEPKGTAPRPALADCVGTDYEIALCVRRHLAASQRCTEGTVEERLMCLERRLVAQENEIVFLRRQLELALRPRIQPLATLPRNSD